MSDADEGQEVIDPLIPCSWNGANLHIHVTLYIIWNVGKAI